MKTEWIAAGLAYAVLLMRLHGLSKQLAAVSHLMRRELAEQLGNEDRVRELREQRQEDEAEQKKEERLGWIGLGIAAAFWLALWFFTAS